MHPLYARRLLLLLFLCLPLFAIEKTFSPSCGELAARVFAVHTKEEAIAHIAQAYQELWQSLAPDASPVQFETSSQGDPFVLPEALRAKHVVLEESLNELKLLTERVGLDPQEVRKTLQQTLARKREKIHETERRIQKQDQLPPIEKPVLFSEGASLPHSNWNGTIFVAKKGAKNLRDDQNVVEVRTGSGEKQTYAFPECSRIDEMTVANDGTLYLVADGWVWRTNLLSPSNRLKLKLQLEKWRKIPIEIRGLVSLFSSHFQLSRDEKLIQGLVARHLVVVPIEGEEIHALPLEKALFSRFLRGEDGEPFGITFSPPTLAPPPSLEIRFQNGFKVLRLDQNGKPRPTDPLACDPLPQGFVPESDPFPLFPSSDPNQVSLILARKRSNNEKNNLVEDMRPLLLQFDLKNKRGKIVPWKGALENPLFAHSTHDRFLPLGQLEKDTQVLLERLDWQRQARIHYLANPHTGEVNEIPIGSQFPQRNKDTRFFCLSTFPGTNRILMKNPYNEMLTLPLSLPQYQ